MSLSRTDVAINNSGGTFPFTSASYTPPSNCLLVLNFEWSNGPVDDIRGGGTVTGGGLTWTRRAGPNTGTIASYTAVHECWTAPVGAAASMTITIDFTGKTSSGDAVGMFDLDAYTGYDTSSPIGATASNTLGTDGTIPVSLTLSGNPASTSYVHAGTGSYANGSNDLSTPGSGWTETYDDDWGGNGANGAGHLQTQIRTASTSTNVAWDKADNNNGGFWLIGGFAIEVKEAAGGDTLMAQIML